MIITFILTLVKQYGDWLFVCAEKQNWENPVNSSSYLNTNKKHSRGFSGHFLQNLHVSCIYLDWAITSHSVSRVLVVLVPYIKVKSNVCGDSVCKFEWG